MKNAFEYIRLIFNIAFKGNREGFVYGVIFVCCFAPIFGVMDAKAALIIEMVIFWGMILGAVIIHEARRLHWKYRHRGFIDCTVTCSFVNSEQKKFNLSLPKEWTERNVDSVDAIDAANNLHNLLKGQL